VLHHHERHDGKGYPRKIAGHQIPIGGRIAALVDCYDAITSERPYSDAMSSYEAIQLMYEFRNKDFQADMVEQFIQCIGLYPAGTSISAPGRWASSSPRTAHVACARRSC